MGPATLIVEIERLKKLLDQGTISQKEFELLKKRAIEEAESSNNCRTSYNPNNTTCYCEGKIPVDMTPVLNACYRADGSSMQILMDITGLQWKDAVGLHAYIRDYHRAPVAFFLGEGIQDIDTRERSTSPRIRPSNPRGVTQIELLTEANNQRLVRCPTCGRQSGEKIGVASRVVSVGAFGLASGKIGKSFRCKSCGYTW